jgi:hypothetical protein
MMRFSSGSVPIKETLSGSPGMPEAVSVMLGMSS